MKKDLRSENVKKIAEVFPMCITEIRDKNGNLKKVIDFEKLKELLTGELRDREEAYEFTWAGKREALRKAFESNDKILRPVVEDSLNFFDTQNIYIEGDNLDVLRILRRSYFEKIKMIYIDPPYNTGHDFIYNDNFKKSKEEEEEELGLWDEEDNMLFENKESNGRFHSDWCSMIYSRLLLARDLLRPDGVIFISIDDNEVASLRKICDEVFGEDNFVGIIIQNKQNSKNDTLNIQKNHEYLTVYRKYKLTDKKTGKTYPSVVSKSLQIKDVFEENGEYYFINDSITTRGEGGTLINRPNLGYTVYYNPLTKDKLAIHDYDFSKYKVGSDYSDIYIDRKDLINEGYIPIRPPKVRGELGVWTWSLEKFNKCKKEIIITGNSKNYSVKKRTFIEPQNINKVENRLEYKNYTISNLKSIWEFSTNDGTKSFNEIMLKSSLFDNPKNVNLIRTIVSSSPPPPDWAEVA